MFSNGRTTIASEIPAKLTETTFMRELLFCMIVIATQLINNTR
jgi:hypothetical protein